MAELVITLSDGRTLRHELGSHPEVMGRDASCEISIDDPSTSRQHAKFSPTPDGYIVEDMGSKNGTLVNDAPCTSQVLHDGDRVLLGSALAVYKEVKGLSSHSVVIAEDLTETHATRYVSRDQRLSLPQRRLEMIYELSGQLTTLQEQEHLLENAMDICFNTLQFERGVIGIRAAEQKLLDWPVVRNMRGKEGEITISRTLLNRALQHGERAIYVDDGSGKADPTVSMVQQGIRSAMCVPLIHQDQILGIFYGDRISTSAAYVDEDIDFFAGIAQQVSIGLINCRLMAEQERMIQLTRELDLARQIQTALFPTTMPDRDEFKVAALNDPGAGVSGDYYDVIEREDGCVWCLVADVTGEGIAAALLMANLQAAVRITIGETDDPAALLSRWNRLIYQNTDSSKFITCLLALVDPEARTIRLASAGHCPPLVLRSGQEVPEEIRAESGLPLGVEEEIEYTSTTIDVGATPTQVLCYTDGVIEAMNTEGHTFGTKRVHDALIEVADESNPQTVVKHLRKEVARFTAGAKQSDDITLLAARVG